jgi:hypothetical protein
MSTVIGIRNVELHLSGLIGTATRAMLAVAYATGRASHVRQVKGDNPDKKGYPGPPGWGFGVGLTTPHSKKLTVTIVEKRKAGWI